MKLFRNILIIVSFAMIANVQAQTINTNKENPISNSFLSISGGISDPIGNFATTTNNLKIAGSYTTPAGFAENGANIAIDGAYFFNKYIGLGGTFSMSTFNINTNAIATGYVIDYDCDEGGAQAGPYHTINFLVGPYFAYPIKKFQFEVRILGGITSTQFPTIEGTAINLPGTGPGPNGPVNEPESISNFYQTCAAADAFGFQTGIGIKYNIYKHFILSLRGDYFYSKPDLSFNNRYRTNVGRILTSYDQPIEGYIGSFGIGYLF